MSGLLSPIELAEIRSVHGFANPTESDPAVAAVRHEHAHIAFNERDDR